MEVEINNALFILLHMHNSEKLIKEIEMFECFSSLRENVRFVCCFILFF